METPVLNQSLHGNYCNTPVSFTIKHGNITSILLSLHFIVVLVSYILNVVNYNYTVKFSEITKRKGC